MLAAGLLITLALIASTQLMARPIAGAYGSEARAVLNLGESGPFPSGRNPAPSSIATDCAREDMPVYAGRRSFEHVVMAVVNQEAARPRQDNGCFRNGRSGNHAKAARNDRPDRPDSVGQIAIHNDDHNLEVIKDSEGETISIDGEVVIDDGETSVSTHQIDHSGSIHEVFKGEDSRGDRGTPSEKDREGKLSGI